MSLMGLRCKLTLRKKCPYLEFFWYVFSRIRTKYEDLRSEYPYSAQIRENADQEKLLLLLFTQTEVYHACQ